jgi:hypothetical protein
MEEQEKGSNAHAKDSERNTKPSGNERSIGKGMERESGHVALHRQRSQRRLG